MIPKERTRPLALRNKEERSLRYSTKYANRANGIERKPYDQMQCVTGKPNPAGRRNIRTHKHVTHEQITHKHEYEQHIRESTLRIRLQTHIEHLRIWFSKNLSKAPRGKKHRIIRTSIRKPAHLKHKKELSRQQRTIRAVTPAQLPHEAALRNMQVQNIMRTPRNTPANPDDNRIEPE